jgi:hypothetical protein
MKSAILRPILRNISFHSLVSGSKSLLKKMQEPIGIGKKRQKLLQPSTGTAIGEREKEKPDPKKREIKI